MKLKSFPLTEANCADVSIHQGHIWQIQKCTVSGQGLQIEIFIDLSFDISLVNWLTVCAIFKCQNKMKNAYSEKGDCCKKLNVQFANR